MSPSTTKGDAAIRDSLSLLSLGPSYRANSAGAHIEVEKRGCQEAAENDELHRARELVAWLAPF